MVGRILCEGLECWWNEYAPELWHHTEACRAAKAARDRRFREDVVEPLRRDWDAFWLRQLPHYPPKAPIRMGRGLEPMYYVDEQGWACRVLRG